ncbi:BPI fold-containing family B member 2 [Rhynochetos jubatus]
MPDFLAAPPEELALCSSVTPRQRQAAPAPAVQCCASPGQRPSLVVKVYKAGATPWGGHSRIRAELEEWEERPGKFYTTWRPLDALQQHDIAAGVPLAYALAGRFQAEPSVSVHVAKLCALSILLSILLVPAHASRSPDCGGILTPSGLSYIAEVSKPHAETVLSHDLMALTVPDLFLGSPEPSRRIQINSVRVAELDLSLIPDTGLQLSIEVDLGITPAPSTTKAMRLSILADLHVEMNPEGNLELVTSSCKPTVDEVPSTEESESKSSSSDLDKGINVDKICLEVSKLLLLPNEQLMSLTAQFPITPSCQVQYVPLAAPMFSQQGVIISLQTTFQVMGMAIPLPVSPLPFSMPEPASSSPSHLTLAFSEHFYTSLFFALEMAGAFNMSIPTPLTTATTAQKITQMGSLFQEDLPVMLQAVFRSSPRVVLEERKAALKLFLTIHVGTDLPAFQSFLSVNVDMSAGLLLSVVDTRMMISAAAIEDIELSLAASDVGPVPDALLEELFLPTIREEVPAQINVVLSEGVFLPHISSFTYADVSVLIHKDYVLVPCNLELQARTDHGLTSGVQSNKGAKSVF